MTGKPSHDLEGNFAGYINTLSDIEDQKLSMEQLDKLISERTRALEETNKELERSNNELQQFAYVASHDLQEPLRKIITFSDRLNNFKENVPEKAKNYIKKISECSLRMTKLIDDLLNFSSITNADKKFVKTDLGKVIKDVLVDFDLIINQRKARVNYDGLPEVQAIPVQMEQLFHNLISNSLKFAKDDSEPVITISGYKMPADELKKYPQLDQSRSYVRLSFKDDGIGFSAEFAEQIFVIFQRLNEQKNVPGTGIGLALCRKIVDNHGGIISAASKKGEGAEFVIVLPERHQ
jgi:two-component system CheB/CheR fusion protein